MGKKSRGIERGLEFVAEHTFALKERLWMENLGENMPAVRGGGDVKGLPKCPGSALVVGAGRSVEMRGQLGILGGSGYRGTIIAADKMLKPCIGAGATPDYAITSDGDEKVAAFYDGLADNGRTKAILHVFSHPRTVAGCQFPKYFFMTPLDDPTSNRSITRLIHFMTGGKTIFSSFGNVGGQAVNVAMFLQADPVIMVGLDHGYPPDTPIEKTTYYQSYRWLAERKGKRPEEYFTKIKNPDTGQEVMLDMNWAAYRDLFLTHMRMAKGKVRVINCSPISSLFGEGIEFMELEEALERWGR